MIIKQINGRWQAIGEWCNNQPHIIYQIPRKVKVDENGQPIQTSQWEYEPADDNTEMVDCCRQGNRCSICPECTDCFQITLPNTFSGDINHYNIILNRTNQTATLGEKNNEGLRFDYTNELIEIQEWFVTNDYKPNKIICGEWTTDDQRWTDYLDERQTIRARQDQLNILLAEMAN